jgi:hypothetical protein
MNTLNDDARQQAQNWSGQLGDLAAGLHTTTPPAASQADPALHNRLSALLARHLRRNSPQHLAARKLQANEFMAGS